MNRGASHQRIFATRADGELFESLLAEASSRHEVDVHAYCLMTNHFHLLLHNRNVGLPAFMHLVESTYGKRFNLRVGRDGPLFRARYLAIPVATPEYLMAAGRYIHRNPLDVAPGRPLDQYRWSSLRCYIGRDPTPAWLHTETLLAQFTSTDTYADFIDDPNAEQRLDAAGIVAMLTVMIDEHIDSDSNSRRGLERAAAIAVAEHCSRSVRDELIASVGLRSATPAWRMARRRALARVQADPRLSAVVDRVIRCAG